MKGRCSLWSLECRVRQSYIKLKGTQCNRLELLGSPTLVGCLKLYCWVSLFISSSFLPEYGSQQPRRGRPANAHQRFRHRCSYYRIDQDISPTPPLILTWVKKCEFWPYRATTVDFEPMWFGNRARYLHPFLSDDLTMFAPNWVQIGLHVLSNTYDKVGAPPKTDEKSVVNHQQLSHGLTDLAQIWYVYRPHDNRPTTKVQSQGIKGQGHSET